MQRQSSAELIPDDPNDPYEDHGLILPNGDINWKLSVLGGMASGPCGGALRRPSPVFHYSQEEVKGSDCLEQVWGIREVYAEVPDPLPPEDDDEDSKGPAEPGNQHLQRLRPL
ncbi:hypothetical protein GDO81_021258 [Engystomops pustulosus]|uniref:Uncharacterized protein n=1 Tax=Engystomops pustulosus TaxID=76066 RepID=A0AAV6ZPI8_ENGPU|nr:hypothetical protein GDO81_021258 [Engystomops pustulosus]